jgi:carbonic anhydrase/acetyltransferase-like protein (isoleucine patch superfamily)
VGDVTIGPDSRVMFGAVLLSQGGPVMVGAGCIVMENAVIRGTGRHPTRIGDHVLVGPRASLSGCTVDDDVFVATGATVFNGARLESRSEVRVNGVVHVNTRVPAGATVPIGWVAVGDPAEILPPGEHERIWTIQERLDFPGTVFGLRRAPEGQSIMPELTRRYGKALGTHRDDRVVED